MKIIEYERKYKEDVKGLLEELQMYIANIDREGYNVVTQEYRDKYYDKTLEEVKHYEGKIFLAIDEEEVKGLIVGIINNEKMETYDFKAPKRGRITELVVRKGARGQGIGKRLIEKMEEYFKSVGCKAVLMGVFAYNDKAYKLYKGLGYFNRTIDMMKNI